MGRKKWERGGVTVPERRRRAVGEEPSDVWATPVR
jgi:hypothetical protein